jgi:iron complex outermembrane receptor protein
VSPTGLELSNPKLKPEKSYSYTLGFIIEPVKNYSVSVDYYSIKINNQIISAFEDPDFDFFGGAVRGAPILSPQNPVGGGAPVETLTPVGPIAYLPVPYVNAAYTHTDGVDIDLRAKTDLWKGWGRLTFDLTESHIFQYVQQYGDGTQVELAGTHGPSGVSGDTGNPRDRAQFIVTYDRGPLTVTATTNWTSGYDAGDPTTNPDCFGTITTASNDFFNGAATFPSSYCRVKAFTTLDLYANYKISKALSIHASILNVGNANAPFDFATYGGGANGASAPYSPSFAQSGAVGRYYQIGAQYRF